MTNYSTAYSSNNKALPITRCLQGELQGKYENDVEAYLDVAYGEHSSMLEECNDVQSWDGIRDASKPAPMFWQTPHRVVFHPDGPDKPGIEVDQSLDAFRMNIWTPSTDGKRPVVFWIHGGGYSSGSCSHPHYDGSKIARDADVVFVGVNYRLGALGAMSAEGMLDNLAIRDLLKSFSWVKSNIEFFGGNPQDIILAGQSAGAWYVVALASTGKIDGQFSRMLIMSCPGSQPISRADSNHLTNAFFKQLGITNAAELENKKPKQILDAQYKAAKEAKKFGVSFCPYDDEDILTGDIFAKAASLCGNKIPLLAGLTHDETTFFINPMADAIRQMDEDTIKGLIADFCAGNCEEDPQEVFENAKNACAETEYANDKYQWVVRASTEALFAYRTRELVSNFSNSWLYEFDIHGSNGGLNASHCIDLPFLFGNIERWHSDPIFEGFPKDKADELYKTLRPALLSFLKNGKPEIEGDTWKRYSTGGIKHIE